MWNTPPTNFKEKISCNGIRRMLTRHTPLLKLSCSPLLSKIKWTLNQMTNKSKPNQQYLLATNSTTTAVHGASTATVASPTTLVVYNNLIHRKHTSWILPAGTASDVVHHQCTSTLKMTKKVIHLRGTRHGCRTWKLFGSSRQRSLLHNSCTRSMASEITTLSSQNEVAFAFRRRNIFPSKND